MYEEGGKTRQGLINRNDSYMAGNRKNLSAQRMDEEDTTFLKYSSVQEYRRANQEVCFPVSALDTRDEEGERRHDKTVILFHRLFK